jgi:hypothetical protein
VESVPGARSTDDDLQQIRANKRFQNLRNEDQNNTSSILEDEFLSENEEE